MRSIPTEYGRRPMIHHVRLLLLIFGVLINNNKLSLDFNFVTVVSTIVVVVV